MYFYNSQGHSAGVVSIHFYSPALYYLSWCTPSHTNFPSTLPTAVDKVWRISLNKTAGIRLKIHCSNVEALNFLLSNETCDKSYWRMMWTRDVEKIAFSDSDSASDYYRPYQQGGSIESNSRKWQFWGTITNFYRIVILAA